TYAAASSPLSWSWVLPLTLIGRLSASSRDSLGEVCERKAQLGQAEPHPPFHGPGRQVQHPGYLAVGESAVIRELDHLALLGGQLDERAAHLLRVVFALHLGVGAIVGDQALCRDVVVDVETGLGGLVAKRIERSMTHA